MKNNLEKLLKTFARFDYYSKQTTAMFHNWLIGTEESEAKDAELRRLWAQTVGRADAATDRSFRQVMSKIGVERAQMPRPVRQLRFWRPVAAAVALVLLSMAATLWVSHDYLERDNTAMVEHYVRNGVREKLSLPDGTVIHLNSGSHVFYPAGLEGKTRTVYLVGEADFKVAKDAKKPFIVRSANLKVTALGTEFNVKAYPEEESIVASLIEGKVRVDCNDTTSYVLQPGHQVVYDRQTADSRMLQADLHDVTAWQRGEVVLNRASVGEVLRTLERRYGIAFHVSRMQPNEDRYSFVFRENAGIEEVLEVMRIVIGPFAYQLEENNCHITWR